VSFPSGLMISCKATSSRKAARAQSAHSSMLLSSSKTSQASYQTISQYWSHNTPYLDIDIDEEEEAMKDMVETAKRNRKLAQEAFISVDEFADLIEEDQEGFDVSLPLHTLRLPKLSRFIYTTE
jgi:hypothetical protein